MDTDQVKPLCTTGDGHLSGGRLEASPLQLRLIPDKKFPDKLDDCWEELGE